MNLTVLKRIPGARANWLRPLFVSLHHFQLWLRCHVSGLLRSWSPLGRALHIPTGVIGTEEILAASTGDDNVLCLYTGATVKHPLPVVNEAANIWYFEENREAVIDPVVMGDFRNARVHGHEGGQLIDRRGRFIWDMGREHWLHFNGFFMMSRLRLPAPQQVGGTLAVLAHPYARGNFSHWIFDVLPRVGVLAATVGLDSVEWFAVGHSRLNYQRETLARLGIPESKVLLLDEDSYFGAERILWPRHSHYHNMSHHVFTREFLRKQFILEPRRRTGRRLYISRADASFRQVIREPELVTALKAREFEVLTLTGVSIEETAQLFHEAAMVVGPFGSGMMNTVFCREGTVIVEICTPHFYNCHHWYLSGEGNLRHHVYFAEPRRLDRGQSMHAVTTDIVIDPGDCIAFIDRVIDLNGAVRAAGAGAPLS